MNELRNSKSDDQLEELLLLTEQMQEELDQKHKHLLQLEKSTIEERIDTAVPQENDGIF